MKYIFIILLILFIIYVIAGWPKGFDIRRETFTSNKIEKPLRFIVLADLHAKMFGENQKDILEIVDKEKPDFIVMPGDILENNTHIPHSFVLFVVLKQYPMYMTLGNHEYYIEDIEEEVRRIREIGVEVLDNQEALIDGGVQLIGLSDLGDKIEDINEPLSFVNGISQKDKYSILLSHRPHYAELYKQCDVDLIISGHAHGGQWRLPNRKGGLFSPDQFFFPKYVEGVHDMNGSTLLISRGLASGRWYIPRLFNNPEIIVVDLAPEENKKSA